MHKINKLLLAERGHSHASPQRHYWYSPLMADRIKNMMLLKNLLVKVTKTNYMLGDMESLAEIIRLSHEE